MNTRYLFRAKRVDNGEWVEGYYANVENEHYIVLENIEWDDDANMELPQFIKVSTSTICQCCGYEGIYEHDIFECDGSIYEIVFDQDDLAWYAHECGYLRISLGEFKPNEIKVIGNSFDNPELLEEES